MKLGINDVLAFGKYKGKPISDVAVDDVGWLLWLRRTRIEKGQDNPFDDELNLVLESVLQGRVSPARRFAPKPVPVTAPTPKLTPYVEEWATW